MKNSSIVLAGVVASRFFVFLFNMIIIRHLSVTEYAHFAFAFSVFNWVLIFSHFDLYAAVSRQISYLRALDKETLIQRYYNHARFLAVGFSVVGMIAAFFIASQQPYDSRPLLIFFAGLIPIALLTINDGYLKGYEKYRDAAIVDAVNGFSKFGIIGIAILFLKQLNLNQVFFLFFMAAVFAYGISSLILKNIRKKDGEPVFDETVKSPNSVTPVKTGVQNALKKLDSDFRQNDKKGNFRLFTSASVFRLDKKIIRGLLHFSKWVCFTDLMNTGILLSGNLILSYYSTVDLARFNLVILIYSVFQIGFGSVTTVLIPQVSRKTAKKEEFRILGWKVLSRLILGTAVLILLILLFPYQDEMLQFFFNKPDYSRTFSYLCILLTSFPFRIITVTNKGIVQGMGHPGMIAMVSVVTSGVNVLLFIPLYSFLGLSGVFVAMTCSYGVEYLLTMTITKRVQQDHLPAEPKMINEGHSRPS